MDRYSSARPMSAGKIESVSEDFNESGAFTVFLTLEGGEKIDVGRDFNLKHNPQPGGYYVAYENGHTMFSPADLFESQHTKL